MFQSFLTRFGVDFIGLWSIWVTWFGSFETSLEIEVRSVSSLYDYRFYSWSMRTSILHFQICYSWFFIFRTFLANFWSFEPDKTEIYSEGNSISSGMTGSSKKEFGRKICLQWMLTSSIVSLHSSWTLSGLAWSFRVTFKSSDNSSWVCSKSSSFVENKWIGQSSKVEI